MRGEVGGWRIAADDAASTSSSPTRPAAGSASPVSPPLARTGTPVLVLVSCDPASLGRDAKLLAAAGYRHERSEVVDTFPHTTHVEAVTRFVRA